MSQPGLTARGNVAAMVQARVLHEALPYVESVHGKVFVVQCDGRVLDDPALRAGLGRDVALLHLVGLRLVLVHGPALGAPLEIVRSHRQLVGVINQQGCRAVGLTEADGGRSCLSHGLIQKLHTKGFIPVVIPRYKGIARGRGVLEANALSSLLAHSLLAEKLLMLGDWPGIVDRDGRLMTVISARDGEMWQSKESLEADTKSRVCAALEAVAHGVRSVHIIDGRCNHALMLEVLSNAGGGTMILPTRAPHFLDDSSRYLDQAEDSG